MEQSMSGRTAQLEIDAASQRYARLIAEDKLNLADAHMLLVSGAATASLFDTAGLAKAIACFQCSKAQS